MDKEELLIELEEIEAYKTLDGKPFDFGCGLITDDSKGGEDAYWEMAQQDVEDCLEELDYSPPKTRRRSRPNRYERKYIERKRWEEIHNQAWHPVWYDEEKQRYRRSYYSGRKVFAKKQSNKKIRHTKDFSTNGGGYRKLFDYWWSVF